MITVINGKRDGFIGKDKIYIGRKNKSYNLNQSPLHNPFDQSYGDKESRLRKYDRRLWESVKLMMKGEKDEVAIAKRCCKQFALINIAIKVLNEENVILACWCKPEKCHGDSIIRCVNWLLNQNWFREIIDQ